MYKNNIIYWVINSLAITLKKVNEMGAIDCVALIEIMELH